MDGGVVAWGDASQGADIPPETVAAVKAGGGARAIATTGQCWAVLLEDGGAAAWGADADCGNKVPLVQITKMKAEGGGLEIYATKATPLANGGKEGAFVVVTRNRTLACWGKSYLAECHLVNEDVTAGGGVKTVFAGRKSFWVHLFDTTMIVWPFHGYDPYRSPLGKPARKGVGAWDTGGAPPGYLVYNDGTIYGFFNEYFGPNEYQ